MKHFKVLLIVTFIIGFSNEIIGQGVDSHINRYLYDNKVLFEDTWEKERPSNTKTRFYIDTLGYIDTCAFNIDNKKLLIYLGENWSLHFLVLKSNKNKTSLLKSIRNLQKPNQIFYFPRKILCEELTGDLTPEVISVFHDPDGPIFKILIYQWKKNTNTLKKVFESEPYFSYPSWNPTIKRKEIKLTEKGIVIPYCEGCHTGEDGKLNKALLYFSKYHDKFLIK